MGKHNNFFEVDPIKEPNKYWIFKELQRSQAVIVEDVNTKDWWDGLARSIGRESKEVVFKDSPRDVGERVVMSPTTNQYSNTGFVVRKSHITLEELKKGAISRFIPKRLDGK